MDAVEEILNGGGTLDGFSLDKVAQQAGVSKGGLLHHFPSKESLLRAASMLQADRFTARFEENLAKEPENRPGRRVRAYIRTGLAPNTNINPLLLSYLRSSENESDGPEKETRFVVWHNTLLNDGIDPTTVSLIRMAVDGVLYTEVIDGREIEAKIRSQLKAHLLALTTKQERKAGIVKK